MTYWLDVYSPAAYADSEKIKFCVSGFPEAREKAVRRISCDDILICYMKDESLWFGALRTTSPYYYDTQVIWKEKLCPHRIRVEPLIIRKPEKAIPAKSLLSRLRLFANLKNPSNWGPPLRTSPRRLDDEDGELILKMLRKSGSGG